MQIVVQDRDKPAVQSDTPPNRLKAFFQRVPLPFPFKKRRRVSPYREVAQSKIEVVGNWLASQYFYNPKEYIERYKLRIFQRMILQSADAKASMTLKKLSILSDGWQIHNADEPGGDEHGEFCRKILNRLPDGFDSVIEHTLDAMVYGFSLSEKVLEPIDKGEFRGLIGYKVIRDKPVYDFTINTNGKGEITGFIQNQEFLGPVEIAPSKMVYFGHQATSDNPYGYSDLCPAFQHVFAQSVMDESWPTALKRYAMPVLLAKNRGGSRTKSDQDYLEGVLKKIDEESGIILNDNVESLEYLEQGTSNMAYTAYQKHQEYRAHQIRMSCLVPDLAISEGSRYGSKSLGSTQIKTFVNMVKQIRRNLAIAINNQIIRPIVDLNFADVENYPLFAFSSTEHEDNVQLAEIVDKFLERRVMFADIDRDWIRVKFGMPALKDLVQVEDIPSAEGDEDDTIDIDPENVEEGNNDNE